MPTPLNLAAIDAGSNAIRLVIASAHSASQLRTLKVERLPVRLGRHVFSQHRFDRQTIDQAVRAFRHFRSLMELYDVKKVRAVATSAVREAGNRRNFVERIYETSGIRLEVIDGAEEARLVRRAVEASAAGKLAPRRIADLGGGSLEISLLKSDVAEESMALPIGTVRMMATFDIQEAMTAQQVRIMRSHVVSLLRRYLPPETHPSAVLAVACGGNAEALALIAPGRPLGGVRTLDLPVLRRKLRQIVSLDIKERMRTFSVRKDRAEVMGIAGIVLAALGQWWKMESFLVPGVGVKEGILVDLLRSLSESAREQESTVQTQAVLSAARRYASRLHWEAQHAEKVSHLAVSLFDQLQPLHKMGPQMRLILELAALLNDIGHVIRHRLHYKPSEYLVRHGDIPGLEGTRREMVSCVIRYHSEPEPDADHKLFNSFSNKQQLQVRSLVALLRVADALDWDHRQTVVGVRARLRDQKVSLGLRMKHSSELILWAARRRAKLLEAVFERKADFQQIR